MNWNEILNAALTALTVSAAASLPPLAVAGFRFMMRKAGLVSTAQQDAAIQFAAEQGVAAAAERLRHAVMGSGEKKHAMAVHVAEQLKPEFRALPDAQKSAIVDATYRRLRPSLQTPDEYVPTLPPPSPLAKKGMQA